MYFPSDYSVKTVLGPTLPPTPVGGSVSSTDTIVSSDGDGAIVRGRSIPSPGFGYFSCSQWRQKASNKTLVWGWASTLSPPTCSNACRVGNRTQHVMTFLASILSDLPHPGSIRNSLNEGSWWTKNLGNPTTIVNANTSNAIHTHIRIDFHCTSVSHQQQQYRWFGNG